MHDTVTAIVIGSLVLGSVYAVVSVGFVILFRTTKVMSFAQGSFMVLGALTYASLTSAAQWPSPAGIVVACLAIGAVGAACFFLIFRRVASANPFITSISTIGLAGILGAILDLTWGSDLRDIRTPYANRAIHLPWGISISSIDLGIVVAGVAILIGMAVLARWTRLGRSMAAVADNPTLAGRVGINPARVAGSAWALSAATSAFAGIAFAMHTTLDPTAIPTLGLLAFPAIILGGIDSVVGAFVGSILLALVQTIAAQWVGGQWQDVAAYVVLFAVLLLRPQGMFGRTEVVRI